MKNLFFVCLMGIAMTFTSCLKEETIQPTSIFNLEVEQELNTSSYQIHAKGNVCQIDSLLGTKDLVAGQDSIIGEVNFGLSPDSTQLVIEITNITADWYIGTSHVYAGLFSDIPMAGGGPKNGHFPYGNDYSLADILAGIQSGGWDSDQCIEIPLTDIFAGGTTGCFVTLVHTEAFNIIGGGSGDLIVLGDETAWGSGNPVNPPTDDGGSNKGKGKGKGKGNWSMYQSWCL